MAETDLYYEPGYLYSETSHHQEPAVSGAPRNGCVRVCILLFEIVQPYSFLQNSSSPRVFLYPEYPRRSCEAAFVAPLNELMRLHQMPPDSATLDSVNCAMAALGDLHPAVERIILGLVQEGCNTLVGERPVGPVSSPSGSMETVITINAEWYNRELVLGEEHDLINAVLEESFEEACGSATKAAKEDAVEKLERFVVDDDEDDDDDDDDDHHHHQKMCAVCMDYMERGNRVARMPCEHVYHEDCIVEWLGVSCSCPICRFELPSNQDDQVQ